MTNVLPAVLPALPGTPPSVSFIALDAGLFALPLALAAALVAAFVVERRALAWHAERAHSAARVVPLRRAA